MMDLSPRLNIGGAEAAPLQEVVRPDHYRDHSKCFESNATSPRTTLCCISLGKAAFALNLLL